MILELDFRAIHVDSAKAAFRSIREEAKLANQAASRVGRSAATGGAAEAQRSVRAAQQQELQGIRALQKARDNQFAAEARIREANGRALVAQRRAQERAAAREETEAKRKHAREELQIKRAALKEELNAKRAAAREERALERTALQEQRKLAREAGRAKKQAERQAERESAATGRYRWDMARTVGGSVLGATRAVGSMGALALGIGGTALVTAGVSEEMNAERQAAILANQAVGTEGESRSAKQIQDAVRGVASRGAARGMAKEDTILALSRFAAISGRLGVGEKLSGTFADLSQAYGADAGDVGSTAGFVAKSILQKNSSIGAEELQKQVTDVLLAMASQAKVGAIEFKDLATQMAKVTTAAGGASGEMVDLITDMGAFMQMASSASPEQAATALESFKSDVVSKSKDLKSMGVQVYTDKSNTQRRGTLDIITDLLRVTKGDQTKIAKIFGERGRDIINPLAAAFGTASGGKTDKASVEKGVRAARDLFTAARAKPIDRQELASAVGVSGSSTATQFETALGTLKDTVGTKLLPALTQLIPAISGLAGPLTSLTGLTVKFLNALAKNPLSTIGEVIALKVAADVGKAMIGESIKNMVLGEVSKGGISGALGGVARGFAGLLGPLSLLIGSLVAVGIAMDAFAEKQDAGTADKRRREGKALQEKIEAANDPAKAAAMDPVEAARLRAGNLTRDEQALLEDAHYLGTKPEDFGTSKGLNRVRDREGRDRPKLAAASAVSGAVDQALASNVGMSLLQPRVPKVLTGGGFSFSESEFATTPVKQGVAGTPLADEAPRIKTGIDSFLGGLGKATTALEKISTSIPDRGPTPSFKPQ